jgi:hypothetical protein
LGEVAARHLADPFLGHVQIALWLSDGTTARVAFPTPQGGTDPADAFRALVNLKRRTGEWLQVDSMDIQSSGQGELFVVPGSHRGCGCGLVRSALLF